MFDLGFWELVIIMIVALLVVGPERLPGLARNVGLWIGKARRFVGSVRADIERQIDAEGLRDTLNQQQSEIEELKGLLNETQSQVKTELQQTDQLVRAIEDQIDTSAQKSPPESGETKQASDSLTSEHDATSGS